MPFSSATNLVPPICAGLGNPIGAHIDGGDNWMQFAGSCDTGAGDSLFCIRSCHGDVSFSPFAL